MSLVLLMVLAVLTWLLCGAVVAGLGLGLHKLAGLTDPSPSRGWLTWWSGLAVLLGLLQAWHLVWPVDALALLLLAALGAGGLWWAREDVLRITRSLWPTHRGAVIAFGLGGLWIANQAAGEATQRVTGLAWYPIVRWYDEFAAVPGVGNVSPTYALNSAWMLVAAWFSESFWAGRVGHVVNGFVLWPLLGQAIGGLVRLRAPGEKMTPAALYDAALVVPFVVLLYGSGTTDPLPGVAASALVLVAWGEGLRVTGPEVIDRGERIDRLLVALLLCVTGFVVMPGLFVALLTTALILGWRLMKTERAWLEARRPVWSIGYGHESVPGAQARSGSVTVFSIVGLAIVLLWTTRNVVLSGYPLYPVTQIVLPVDWVVPTSVVAKLDGLLPPPTAGAVLASGFALCLLPALAGLAGFLTWMAGGGGEGRWKELTLGLPALGVGLLGWFMVSGEVTGGAGPAWALALLGGALAVAGVHKRGRATKGPTLSSVYGTLGTTCVVVVLIGGWRVAADGRGHPLASVPLRWPGLAGFDEKRTEDLPPWASRWGVTVNVGELEVVGTAEAPLSPLDLRPELMPWYADQPSAAMLPDVNLRYRVEGDPGSGFVIDRRGGSLLDAPGYRQADRGWGGGRF